MCFLGSASILINAISQYHVKLEATTLFLVGIKMAGIELERLYFHLIPLLETVVLLEILEILLQGTLCAILWNLVHLLLLQLLQN